MGNLHFDVEYYDKKHEDMLKNCDCKSKMDDIVKNGVRTSFDDFIAYSVFREQKDHDGWRTYSDLKRRAPGRVDKYKDYFDTEGGTVRSKFKGQNNLDIAETEAGGVAASLTIGNSLYDLTEADWTKIDISKKKDLDFQIAGHDDGYAVIESKGTVVSDTSMKQDTVSKAKKSIENKKEVQRNTESAKPNATYIGVIALFPTNNTQNAKCLLLDPPGPNIDMEPAKYRLLARLTFYLTQIRLLSSSQICAVLANRIQAIANTNDWRSLDGLPLLNRNGNKMDIPYSFYTSKTVVGNNLAFGRVFAIGHRKFLYYGLDFKVISQIIGQKFSAITRFKSVISDNLHRVHKVGAIVDKEDVTAYDNSLEGFTPIKHSNKFSMGMEGRFYASSAGRVFGFIEA